MAPPPLLTTLPTTFTIPAMEPLDNTMGAILIGTFIGIAYVYAYNLSYPSYSSVY